MALARPHLGPRRPCGSLPKLNFAAGAISSSPKSPCINSIFPLGYACVLRQSGRLGLEKRGMSASPRNRRQPFGKSVLEVRCSDLAHDWIGRSQHPDRRSHWNFGISVPPEPSDKRLRGHGEDLHKAAGHTEPRAAFLDIIRSRVEVVAPAMGRRQLRCSSNIVGYVSTRPQMPLYGIS